MRTYLNTLLHRKRGAYGPLWIFELDQETWAIVWSGWLADEPTCHLILSEDPAWFNRDWGMDGRRPNPTYKTQHAALEEVVWALREMMGGLQEDDPDQRQYAIYISDAEHDLHRLQTRDLHTSGATVSRLENVLAAPAVARVAETADAGQTPGQGEKTPVPVAQATASKARPWDGAEGSPKGVNFQPSAELHAKMEWVSKNVPGGMSRLAILREGAMMLCDALIAKHYREDE